VFALGLGVVVVAAAVAVGYAGSLHELWRGAVTYHRHTRDLGSGSNFDRVRHFFDLHTPFGWLVVAGAAAALFLAIRHRRSWWTLWTWPVCSVVVLLVQRPLLDHHFVVLAAALALAVGVSLARVGEAAPRVVVVGAAAVFAALFAAGVYQEHRRIDRNLEPEPPGVVWAAGRLHAETRPGAAVAGDLPIVAFLAHRRIPGQLVDTSAARLESGFLTPAEVLRLLDRKHVRAVVVGRVFARYPKLVTGIERRFPRREARASVTVYLR
jgi:hypothetical protein